MISAVIALIAFWVTLNELVRVRFKTRASLRHKYARSLGRITSRRERDPLVIELGFDQGLTSDGTIATEDEHQHDFIQRDGGNSNMRDCECGYSQNIWGTLQYFKGEVVAWTSRL